MLPLDLPEPEIRPRSRWIPSLVWIVPLVCALIGLALVYRGIAATGPTITVTFANAEGLEAGKTKVRYKDVDIGSVQAITLTPDFKRVVVRIQLTKDAAQFANRDTRFWVVRPRIGATGISGLGTLLSGAYIGADLGRRRGAVLTGVVGEAAARPGCGEKLDLEAEDPQLLLDPLHARIFFGAPDQQHVRLALREGRGSKEKRERARDEREACANASQRVRMLLARAAYEPFG